MALYNKTLCFFVQIATQLPKDFCTTDALATYPFPPCSLWSTRDYGHHDGHKFPMDFWCRNAFLDSMLYIIKMAIADHMLGSPGNGDSHTPWVHDPLYSASHYALEATPHKGTHMIELNLCSLAHPTCKNSSLPAQSLGRCHSVGGVSVFQTP